MNPLNSKTAVSIALAAVAGVASAQSSVSIYGTVDLAVAKSNGGAANNPAFGTVTTSNSYQVTQGRANRLGFRGSEDLGGGMSAQFQIEHRFNADTGTVSNGNAFWQGLSYVQLSSKSLGRVYLGRNYTPAFLVAVRLDPFGWDGVGEMGSLQFGNYRTPDPSGTPVATNTRSVTNNGIRESNAVGYVSPSFSGLSVHAAGGLSEATGNDRPMSVNLNFESGPLYLAANVERVYNGSYAGQGIAQLGASYDFGISKVMAYVARTSYGARTAANGTVTFSPTVSTANGLNRAHAKVYEIAAVTPIGGGAIKAGYIRVDPDGPNNLIQKLGLGYDYFLSKRTKVYIDGGYAKEDALSRSKLVAVGIRNDF